MTPLCQLHAAAGACSLPERHRGEHYTRSGKSFTYEDAMAWQKRAHEPAAADYMNRAERRAAKKAKKPGY